jgi:hypothetical protein
MNPILFYEYGKDSCNFDRFGYDLDFVKVLKKACTLKYALPHISKRSIINQLFLDLKINGMWYKQDLILNFAYNDTNLADFSRLNLKNPDIYQADVSAGLQYSVNGFKGTGIDGIITTNYNPLNNGVKFMLNDAGAGAIVYQDGVINATQRLVYYGGTNNRLTNIVATQQRINSGSNVSLNMIGTGYKGLFRESATQMQSNNKTDRITSNINSSSITNYNITLISTFAGQGDIGESFFHIGGYMADLEIQDIRFVYNKYMTDMGLNPIA